MKTLKHLALVQEALDSGKVHMEHDGLILRFRSRNPKRLHAVRHHLIHSFHRNGHQHYYLSDIWQSVKGDFQLLAVRSLGE